MCVVRVFVLVRLEHMRPVVAFTVSRIRPGSDVAILLQNGAGLAVVLPQPPR